MSVVLPVYCCVLVVLSVIDIFIIKDQAYYYYVNINKIKKLVEYGLREKLSTECVHVY